jgi:hypothetical protein
MKIITITYNRTVNLGNYESKRLEATCEVDDAEDPSAACDELRAWVIAELQKTGPTGNGG